MPIAKSTFQRAWFWQQQFPSDSLLTAVQVRKLEDLALGREQLRWLLEKYRARAVYRTVDDFAAFAALELDNLPEEFVCAAWNSGDATLRAWADEAEELAGAWSPTPETTQRLAELKRRIEAAL